MPFTQTHLHTLAFSHDLYKGALAPSFPLHLWKTYPRRRCTSMSRFYFRFIGLLARAFAHSIILRSTLHIYSQPNFQVCFERYTLLPLSYHHPRTDHGTFGQQPGWQAGTDGSDRTGQDRPEKIHHLYYISTSFHTGIRLLSYRLLYPPRHLPLTRLLRLSCYKFFLDMFLITFRVSSIFISSLRMTRGRSIMFKFFHFFIFSGARSGQDEDKGRQG